MKDSELIVKTEELVKEMERCIFFDKNTVTEVFKVKMTQMHRTLQQDFWRMFYDIACDFSKRDKDYFVDARNEASYNLCKKIAEIKTELPNL